jgi:hypothetical protein
LREDLPIETKIWPLSWIEMNVGGGGKFDLGQNSDMNVTPFVEHEHDVHKRRHVHIAVLAEVELSAAAAADLSRHGSLLVADAH